MKRGFGSGRTLPVAESVASRIACLPLYNELAEEDIRRICEVIFVAL